MQRYLEPRKISWGNFCQSWCRALSCEFWKLACPKLTCVSGRIWWVYLLHIKIFWLGSLPSSGKGPKSYKFPHVLRLLILACLVSFWALGSSSWKKAKISDTRRAGVSGERGQSKLQRRLWGIWVETAGDWRPSLDRMGMWADCLQVVRESLITRQVKGMCGQQRKKCLI